MRPTGAPQKPRLDWLDAIKAFALVGILLNHLVETFGPGPWFTNPSERWPDLQTRLRGVFPSSASWPVALVQFLGWLGDSGPGVFILASGFSLMWGRLGATGPESDSTFLRRRLNRLLPLYVAVHFVVLAGAIWVPGNEVTLGGRRTLLSLFGLRFTDELFFHISPSWWFVWLILQLYAVFPWLARLLERAGPRRFVVVTWLATFAVRALALAGVRPESSLYFWMTGLFFGTRLAEFALGMALASVVRARLHDGRALPAPWRVLTVAAPAYVLGFLCSLTWAGSVVSNALVTTGLSGLFFFCWEAAVSRVRLLARSTLWVGRNSYGVFLLHQPPLMWTGAFFGGRRALHLASAVLALALSFPASAYLERLVNAIAARVREGGNRTTAVMAWAGLAAAVLGLAVAEPTLALGPTRARAALAWALGLAALALGLALRARGARDRRWMSSLRFGLLLACLVHLYVLPEGLGPLALAVGLLVAVLATAAHAVFRWPPAAWTAATAGALALVGLAEAGLWRLRPVEAGAWGELPALERHPTRVYGLKPNRRTRLRYNNYDYVLRSNSHGLASPQIAVDRPSADTFRLLVAGDAFSMPEGVAFEESWPALLERQLAGCLAPRPVQVINAGVTGYGPVEEVAQVGELGPLFRPDVVAWQFFVNEFVEARVSPEERLAEIGLSSTPSLLSRNGVARTQLAGHARLLQAAALERLSGRPAGWRYGKALLEYYRTGPNDIYAPESLAAVRSQILAMKRAVAGVGGRLVLYFVPAAAAVLEPAQLAYFPWDQDLSDRARYDLDRPLRHLRELAQGIGVPVVDLTPDLRAHPRQPVYFAESWHWNREGHSVVASAVARSLAAQGLLGSPCRQPAAATVASAAAGR